MAESDTEEIQRPVGTLPAPTLNYLSKADPPLIWGKWYIENTIIEFGPIKFVPMILGGSNPNLVDVEMVNQISRVCPELICGRLEPEECAESMQLVKEFSSFTPLYMVKLRFRLKQKKDFGMLEHWFAVMEGLSPAIVTGYHFCVDHNLGTFSFFRSDNYSSDDDSEDEYCDSEREYGSDDEYADDDEYVDDDEYSDDYGSDDEYASAVENISNEESANVSESDDDGYKDVDSDDNAVNEQNVRNDYSTMNGHGSTDGYSSTNGHSSNGYSAENSNDDSTSDTNEHEIQL